jgi:SAM-dependent methyltransferase
MLTTEEVRADFDELADLIEPRERGIDRYDAYLLSLIPPSARSVLDVGCGLGRLTRAIASGNRNIVGLDVSPRMIARAKSEGTPAGATFLEGDFLELDLGERRFDCIVSAAALHHMPAAPALRRMCGLLRPGGRLVIHDLRRDSSAMDVVRSYSALARVLLTRLVHTGRIRQPKRVRQAWGRHGAREEYLSLAEAEALASRELPGAIVQYHWLWRYTLVWDKPDITTDTRIAVDCQR